MSNPAQTPNEDGAVQAFVYGTADSPRPIAAHPAAMPMQTSAAVDEEIRRREARAREEGIREGQQRGRAQYEQEIQSVRQTLSGAIAEFGKSRDTYFHQIEGDVVQLALAIAANILHREAQIEPLLLRGAVKVALEKVAANTHVTLRVAPEKEAAWRSHFMTEAYAGPSVDIVADMSLTGDACSLETSVGQIDLSVEAQLGEIQQGFFDLLSRRPAQS